MLADRNIRAVSKAAGVHPNAVYRLMNGSTNPRYDTVQKLIAYLQGRTEVQN
ncbi:helix-turn-helix transcriptional regulator [Microcystis sp. M018S1]|uniref:helix-turn-helix transcriptional regulator n=1 Tax=Microcystis sp. M018S1 TaxID=2771108 RepID=UPI0033906706